MRNRHRTQTFGLGRWDTVGSISRPAFGADFPRRVHHRILRQTVSERGDGEPKYIQSTTGYWHFLWFDFYPFFSAEGTTLQQTMHALFDANLFQPGHWGVGRLNRRDETERKLADRRFAELLRPTVAMLEGPQWGYEVTRSWTSSSQLYACAIRPREIPEVRIDPRFNPGAFKIILKVPSKVRADRVAAVWIWGLLVAVDIVCCPF